MPGSKATLVRRAGKALGDHPGRARVRGAGDVRGRGRGHLPFRPPPQADQADAAGRRRQRRPGHRSRRSAQTGPSSAGHRGPVERWPRTRSCSRWRRCSTGSAPGGASRPGSTRDPPTRVERHTLRGNLVVVGAGDPALGRAGFARRNGLPLTPLGDLAAAVRKAGIKRVSGKVLADDTIFDRRRGVPSSGVDASGELGPLSGLSYNSGIVHGHYAENPELVAARALKHKLRAAGVFVGGGIGRADLPARALRRTGARDRRLAPGQRLAGRNPEAVQQLLRRDAAEAPGGLPRGRARDHPSRGSQGEAVRPPRRQRRGDGERLRTVALRSRLAATGRATAGGDAARLRGCRVPTLHFPLPARRARSRDA